LSAPPLVRDVKREKPTAWPKSGRANPTLVGAFGRADPLGTSEINDCRMILYLRSLSPLRACTGDFIGAMGSRRLKPTGN
jgi:hypothetical protein